MDALKSTLVGWCLALAVLCAPGALAAIDTGNHIEFSIVVNAQADNRESYENGSGFWVSYRRDLVPHFSLGLTVGVHEFHICRCDINQPDDRVVSVPVLITAHVDTAIGEWVTLFGEVSVGVAFNEIDGDVADQYDLTLDPALAGDIAGGVLVNLLDNLAVGGRVDIYLSQANLDPNALVNEDTLNLGHYGAGFLIVLSF